MNRAKPDGCGCLGAGLRVLLGLLPVLRLEALGREDALLRLREGEDARVAMRRRVGDGCDDSELPRRVGRQERPSGSTASAVVAPAAANRRTGSHAISSISSQPAM